jgi:predicted NBD/HSP70 family sugar kinase
MSRLALIIPGSLRNTLIEELPLRPNGGVGRGSSDTSPAGTNLERGSLHNQRVVLQAIRANDRITVAELARLTGLTSTGISAIIRRQLEEGLIREVGRIQGARGQPAMRYSVNADGAFSLGVNLDRDHVTLIGLDLAGATRWRSSLEVSFPPYEEVRGFIRQSIEDLRRDGGIAFDRIIGIGVAVPDELGAVALPDPPAGYTDWSNVDFKSLMNEVLPGISVHVENDAYAAAVGEMHFGYGLTNPNFFYLLVSVGLGGSMVLNGTPIAGATARAGEIGHLVLRRPKGATLGSIVSLAGLYQFLRGTGHAAKSVSDLRNLGDASLAVARGWLMTAAEVLEDPLVLINLTLNPAAFYIGGRLPDPLIEELAAELNARLRRHAAAAPHMAPVLRAALATDAAAVGAAILPFSDQLLPSRTFVGSVFAAG